MLLVDGEDELRRELQQAFMRVMVVRGPQARASDLVEAVLPVFRRELAKAVAAAPYPRFQQELARQVAKETSVIERIRPLVVERYTGGTEYEAGLDDMAGLVLDLIDGKGTK